jgi:hypothetical protein
MTREALDNEALDNDDWRELIERLGGMEAVEASARETKAFLRPREITSAADLLRLVLAYCMGSSGLRSTAAWAASVGLADMSNVAVLYRLRQCGDWLAVLIGRVLGSAAPEAGMGRLLRLVDGTTVPQAGPAARRDSKLWRIHGAFDLPGERFGFFELTDQREGERFDRAPVVKGEIRMGDRVYLQPDRIAAVIQAGGDVVVRAGWKGACWLDAEGTSFDLIAALHGAAAAGLIDRPIWLERKNGPALGLRLVAVRKPAKAAEAARRKAHRDAQREGYQVSKATLLAAEWVILVTSLDRDSFVTEDVLALYRLRWRIELAFKRLKSLIGLRGPPGVDERSARPYVLAHLLMILLLEPLVDELEDSPRLANAA